MNKLLGRSKKKENTTAANISETASSKKTETNGRKLKASPSPKKPVNEGAFCPFFVRWGSFMTILGLDQCFSKLRVLNSFV